MIIEQPYIIHNREWSIKHTLKFSPQIWSARPQDSQTQVTPSQLPIQITKTQIKEKYSNSITIYQVTLALLLKLSTKAALSKASSTFLGGPPTAAVASATLTSLAAMSMGQESGRQFTHSCALFKAVEKKVHISHYFTKKRKARIFKLIKHFHWIFN